MKIKYDVSGSDPEKASGSNFQQPKPGVYTVKVREIEAKDSKAGNPMLVVNVEVVNDEEFKGSYLRDYIGLTDSTAWKLDQFLQAFGVTSTQKRSGTLDTDTLLGKTCDVRVKGETYNDSYQAKISAWIIGIGGDAGDDEDGFVDEGDADFDEDVADAEPAPSADDQYDAMSTMDLRKELAERELETKGPKPALVARLREDDGADAF